MRSATAMSMVNRKLARRVGEQHPVKQGIHDPSRRRRARRRRLPKSLPEKELTHVSQISLHCGPDGPVERRSIRRSPARGRQVPTRTAWSLRQAKARSPIFAFPYAEENRPRVRKGLRGPTPRLAQDSSASSAKRWRIASWRALRDRNRVRVGDWSGNGLGLRQVKTSNG